MPLRRRSLISKLHAIVIPAWFLNDRLILYHTSNIAHDLDRDCANKIFSKMNSGLMKEMFKVKIVDPADTYSPSVGTLQHSL